MSDDIDKTQPSPPAFDFSAYPENSLFHDRRGNRDRRSKTNGAPGQPAEARPAPSDRPQPERRAKKERRKRIDPTTFEKQYTDDEMEFMTAIQGFKEQSGKPFPTYGEVIRIAVKLGYRKVVIDESSDDSWESPHVFSPGD